MLNLTFTEFTAEGAVKPLTTVLPAHRRAHGGSATTTTHKTLWLVAHWQGLLEATNTHTFRHCLYLHRNRTLRGLIVALQNGFNSMQTSILDIVFYCY